VTRALVFDDLDWMADAHIKLVEVAAEGKPFTAYTLTQAGLRQPPSSAMWGTLFREAARLRLITHRGWVPSERPGRKGGVCAQWRARRIATKAAA
jgi:hypothetical protein